MRYVAVVLAGIALASCQSEEERRAEFIKLCSDSEFTVKQCNVLYLIAKYSADAKDSAEAASISSGIAIGISAGSAGRR